MAPLVHSFTGSLPEVLLQSCRAEKLEAGVEEISLLSAHFWTPAGVWCTLRSLNGEERALSGREEVTPLLLCTSLYLYRCLCPFCRPASQLEVDLVRLAQLLAARFLNDPGPQHTVTSCSGPFEAQECLQLQRASSEMRFALEEATEQPPESSPLSRCKPCGLGLRCAAKARTDGDHGAAAAVPGARALEQASVVTAPGRRPRCSAPRRGSRGSARAARTGPTVPVQVEFRGLHGKELERELEERREGSPRSGADGTLDEAEARQGAPRSEVNLPEDAEIVASQGADRFFSARMAGAARGPGRRESGRSSVQPLPGPGPLPKKESLCEKGLCFKSGFSLPLLRSVEALEAKLREQARPRLAAGGLFSSWGLVVGLSLSHISVGREAAGTTAGAGVKPREGSGTSPWHGCAFGRSAARKQPLRIRHSHGSWWVRPQWPAARSSGHDFTKESGRRRRLWCGAVLLWCSSQLGGDEPRCCAEA